MPGERTVFLDFDDTLSDPFQFHVQYVREVGALLAPRYGGSEERWAKAAIDLLESVEAEYVKRFAGNPLNGYCAWLETVRARSAVTMFQWMGIPCPPDPAQIARETQFEALRRSNATFPGAVEALEGLRAAGFRMHIASGQESEYLAAALMGAGLDRFLGMKFGPDLVDCAKEGPEYYERIFAAAGVKASDAIVVDDHPPAIDWALLAGAAVIQSKLSRERRYDIAIGVAGVMTDMRELPGLVNGVRL